LLNQNFIQRDKQNRLFSPAILKELHISEVRAQVGKLGGNPLLLNQKDKEKDKQNSTSTSTSTSDSNEGESEGAKSPAFDADSEPSILATELKDAILRWKPGTRTAGFSKWSRTIDLMIRKDGRTPEAIRNAISWLYGPNTERGEYAIVVLSAQALRDKFDQIEVSMNKRSAKNTKMPTSGNALHDAIAKRNKLM
jgi:hypothetical protein